MPAGEGRFVYYRIKRLWDVSCWCATVTIRTRMSDAQPLRILHYLPTIKLSEGGIARAVLDWCTVLANRGHRVTLITADASDVPAWSGTNAPKLIKLNAPPA